MIMKSNFLFNNSKLDKSFVLDIDDKIIDDKSEISCDNDQKQLSIPMSQLVDSYFLEENIEEIFPN